MRGISRLIPFQSKVRLIWLCFRYFLVQYRFLKLMFVVGHTRRLP